MNGQAIPRPLSRLKIPHNPTGKTHMPYLFASPKRQGEWAELAFMTKAARMGWNVARIFGDSTPYDVIIERRGLMLRIQVKSVLTRRHNAYPILTGRIRKRKTKTYKKGDFDFLAAYIIPLDTWYLIPISKIAGIGMIYLRPHRKSRATTYEDYKENWPSLTI
jgi:hypothetical protein